MPGHDFLYLGDTARVPYGTRSEETVVRYSLAVASNLVERGVDAIVIACNTASTHALPALKKACSRIGVPVFGVVAPGVTAALEVHDGGAVAVLGTAGTIRGAAYQKALSQCIPNSMIFGVACPMFVPLVEEGWLSGEVPSLVAEHYLGALRGRVSTAILGCTHYPLLRDTIQAVLPKTILIDSAVATANQVRDTLGHADQSRGSISFLVTDHPEKFEEAGVAFLGFKPTQTEWIDLSPASAPF